MNNPLRGHRLLLPGIVAVVLGAGWTSAQAQAAADAPRRDATVLTSPVAEMPQGPQGRYYTQTFVADGGVAPYAFAVTGSLPTGMRWTEAKNGLLLDGVPQAMGDFPLSVAVTDGIGQRSVHDYVLHVTPFDTGSSVNIPITEPVSVTDTPSEGTAVPINVTEAIAVSDAPSATLAVMVSVTEAVAVADVITAKTAVSISVVEGLSVSDITGTVVNGYILAVSNSALSKFNEDGSAISPSAGYTGGGGPTSGLAVDATGNYFSVNKANNVLVKFNSAGAAQSGSGYTGGGLSAPAQVAVDGAGSVWITNGSGPLSEFTGAGMAVSPASGFTGVTMASSGDTTVAYHAPTGIAIDRSGNVWVADSLTNSVTEVLGAAAPAAPLATAVSGSLIGTRP